MGGVKTFCVLINPGKDQLFTQAGETPQSFGFVYAGLLGAYVTDAKGIAHSARAKTVTEPANSTEII